MDKPRMAGMPGVFFLGWGASDDSTELASLRTTNWADSEGAAFLY
jgi:hypothetical protein